MFKMINEVEWKINVGLNDLSEFIKKNNKCFKNFGGDIETFLSKDTICIYTHLRSKGQIVDKVMTLNLYLVKYT